MKGRTVQNQLGGGHKRRFRLSPRRHPLLFTITAATLAITLIPLGVHAVQNIFTGFGQITDIQFEGQNIDKVVYQGVTLWERQSAPAFTDMQQVGAGKKYSCPTTRTVVRDARDNATYWIRKIPNTKSGGGDLCWMETNLAYVGGGTNTYGDATPAIAQVSTSADYTDTAARIYLLPTANRTTGTTDPSTSTDGTGQYGYLYNYCAAMNSQSAACQNTTSTQPNQSVNGGSPTTQFNVCPAGWRLPISNEWAALNAAVNGSSTTDPTGLLSNSLLMYAGGWYGGEPPGQGWIGYYWSSSTPYAAAVYTFRITAGTIDPAYLNYKRNVISIRCVAP